MKLYLSTVLTGLGLVFTAHAGDQPPRYFGVNPAVLLGVKKRIAVQIKPDGRQPLELERTSALGYSKFNLEALFELATMAGGVGVDLWHYQSPQGGSLRKALDFLLPYVADPRKTWPYQQIKKLSPDSFAPLRAQAASVYDEPQYAGILSGIGGLGSKRLKLIYSLEGVSLDIAAIERQRIFTAADAALALKPPSITAVRVELSAGGPNDFYSNGDYWWPDPAKPGGLPYIQRDGQTNPGNFTRRRLMILELRDSVAALAAAYRLSGEEHYVRKAVCLLDLSTRQHGHSLSPAVRPG